MHSFFPETPFKSFFSDNDAPHSGRLDGMPRGQCRLVSVNEPTDAVASRDLGGAVAVELPGATGGATHGVWLGSK